MSTTKCNPCNLSPREFFLLGARYGFGAWLLYAGLSKWVGGPSNFIGYITTQFDQTWSPHILNYTLGWLIIIAEPVVALWLLVGKHQRCAWTSASLLMFLLLIGVTMLQKPEVIANFQYFVFCLGCAAWSSNTPCQKSASVTP